MTGPNPILRAAAAACALLLLAPADAADCETVVEQPRSESTLRPIDPIAAELRSIAGVRQ